MSKKFSYKNKNSNCSEVKVENSVKNSKFPIDYSNYIFQKGDNYESLKRKNENLRQLIIQANEKLNMLMKEQAEQENDHQIEKKSILEQLEKISSNYKLYANSHKILQSTEQKMNSIMQNYNNLNKEYSKMKELLRGLINNIYDIYLNVDVFLKENTQDEKNYDNNFKNPFEAFSYLIKLRNNIYDQYNKMCSQFEVNNIENNNNNSNNNCNNFTLKKNYSYNNLGKQPIQNRPYTPDLKNKNNYALSNDTSTVNKRTNFININREREMQKSPGYLKKMQQKFKNITKDTSSQQHTGSKVDLNSKIYSNFTCFGK